MDEQRARDTLLVALAVSSGAVDAVSWLGLGKVFSSFMTGNLAFLGFGVAGAEAPSLVRTATSLAAFSAGAAVGGRIVSGRRSGGTWPRGVTTVLGIALVAQAVFLAVWLVVDGRPSSGTANALIAVSALAMGMQSVAVFSLGVRAVFTTAATATWAVLMGDLSDWSASRQERRRLAAVLVGLFAGAFAGGLLFAHARAWAPVFPLALSAAVVAGAASRFAPDRRSGRAARPRQPWALRM